MANGHSEREETQRFCITRSLPPQCCNAAVGPNPYRNRGSAWGLCQARDERTRQERARGVGFGSWETRWPGGCSSQRRQSGFTPSALVGALGMCFLCCWLRVFKQNLMQLDSHQSWEYISAAVRGSPVYRDELYFLGFAWLMLLSAISKLENKQIQYLIFWHRYCTLGSKQKFHQQKTDKGVMGIVHNVKSGSEIRWMAHCTEALPSCARHYS